MSLENFCYRLPVQHSLLLLEHNPNTVRYSNTSPVPCLSYQIFLPVLISKKKQADFDETVLYQVKVELVDQSFSARKVLPFIYSVALPWSSMSHFHCWCWCHFSNALMGKGICMTPPPPLLTTNSSFNTSTKFPDLFVTQFLNLVHFLSSFWRLLLWSLCV